MFYFKGNKNKHCIVIFLFSVFSIVVHAKIDISGFASTGVVASDTSLEYENWVGENVNYESMTRLGLNFSADLNQGWSTHFLMIVKPGVDAVESRPAMAPELAVIGWQFNDANRLRFGRLRLPWWAVSEYYQVGYLQPWVKPPRAVYGLAPLSSYEGISWNSRFELGPVEFESELGVGGGSFEFSGYFFGETVTLNGNSQDLVSYSLTGRMGSFTGKAVATQVHIQLDQELTVDTSVGPGLVQEDTFRTVLSSGLTNIYGFSLNYNDEKWMWFAEYVALDDTEDRLSFFDGSGTVTVKNSPGWGYYGTFGRYFSNGKYLVHGTFSEGAASGKSSFQQTRSLGFNCYLSDSTVAKLMVEQAFYIEGNSGGFSSDPGRDVTIVAGSVDILF